MHFCMDEWMAIMAAIPGVPFVCWKCRAAYYRFKNRNAQPKL